VPAAVAVGPIQSPFSVIGGELHSCDALSRPFEIRIFGPRRPTFDDRDRISSNVYFHPDLILKIWWDDFRCVLANLSQITIGNGTHIETLQTGGRRLRTTGRLFTEK
jgi:hypothetical protein